MSANAVITIDTDENGQIRATIMFDPPLPPRPDNPEDEEKWLNAIPSAQLCGIVAIDEVMDTLGDDVELDSITMSDIENGTRH